MEFKKLFRYEIFKRKISTIDTIVEKITNGLQPQEHAIITGATFELFLIHAKLDEKQLAAALNMLCKPLDSDLTIRVTKRRETLEEIVKVLKPTSHKDFKQHSEKIKSGWTQWRDFLSVETNTVPLEQKCRYEGMLEIAYRELYELRLHIADLEPDKTMLKSVIRSIEFHRRNNICIKK